MIILVDQDGVLTNLSEQFITDWKETYPNYSCIPHEERTMFYMTDEYPKEYKEKIREIMYRKNFFRKLKPVEGAIDGIKNLENREHTVFICSSPFTNSKYCANEKHEWIREHLGNDWTKKLILTKDKTLIYGDYLIDDKPSVTGIKKPSWEHIVYEQPYNVESNAKYRINWSNYKEILRDFI